MNGRNNNAIMANMRANIDRANNRRMNFLLHDDSGIDSDDELLEQRRHPKRDENDPFLVLSEDEEVGYLNYMRYNMEREFGHLPVLIEDDVMDRNRLRVGSNSPIMVSPNRGSPPLYEVELSPSDEDEESVLELVLPIRSRYNKKSTVNIKSLIFGTFLCCFARK